MSSRPTQRSSKGWLALGLAIALVVALPAVAEDSYVGSETCLACHSKLQAPFEHTRHGKLFNAENALSPRMKQGCEACHGAGSAHVEAGGGKITGDMLVFRGGTPEVVERENASCLGCHEGGTQLYWEGSAHDSRGLACTSCHSSHEPRSEKHQLKKHSESETCGSCHQGQRAQQARHSRMPVAEGHMECSSCHNAHGAVSESLIKHTSINANCLSCHADKRGPFLWEHPPVSENCLSCHQPHGSSKRGMLRVNQPRLCQQCHVATRHPSEAHGPGDRFTAGASCSNCHINIHGSNHPSGSVFSR